MSGLANYLDNNIANDDSIAGDEYTMAELSLGAAECEILSMEAAIIEEEVDRLLDMSTGLEELGVILSSIKTPTKEHNALAQNSMTLAFAGSGYDPIEHLPSMEDEDYTVSMEGTIGDMVKRVYEGAKKHLAKLWKRNSEIWYNLTARAPRYIKTAEKLKERAEKAMDKTMEEKTIEMGKEVNNLTIDYKPVKKVGDIKKGLTNINEAAEFVLNETGKSLISVGEAVLTGMQEFDVNDGEASLRKMVSKIKGVKTATKPKKLKMVEYKNNKDTRHPQLTNIFASEELLGTKTLFIYAGTPDDDGDGVLSDAAVIRRRGMAVLDVDNKSAKALNDAKLDTLSPGDIITLCDSIIDVCTLIGSYDKGKYPTEMKKMYNDIEKAAGKVTKDSTSSDAEGGNNPAYVRSGTTDFMKTYQKWITTPHRQVSTHALTVCGAVLTYASKSLSVYK